MNYWTDKFLSDIRPEIKTYLKSGRFVLANFTFSMCWSNTDLPIGYEMYVTYENVDNPAFPKAAQMAQTHCFRYGKNAVPQQKTATDSSRTFECKWA